VRREKLQRQRREERRQAIAEDYTALKERIEGDDILEACVMWMKDIYIAGGGSKENKKLGTKHSRADIADAVQAWRDEDGWALHNLQKVKDLHGYPVGPKDPHVGDTLDRRGDQGNIIATWSATKINIHIDPSD